MKINIREYLTLDEIVALRMALGDRVEIISQLSGEVRQQSTSYYNSLCRAIGLEDKCIEPLVRDYVSYDALAAEVRREELENEPEYKFGSLSDSDCYEG